VPKYDEMKNGRQGSVLNRHSFWKRDFNYSVSKRL